MNSKIFSSVVAFAITQCALYAAEIHCAGILGNSGEAGDSLVKTYAGDFPANGAPVSGAGVAVDDFGAMFVRGANGTLLRIAQDGRLLATYSLPKYNGSADRDDIIVRAGNLLVLRQKGEVCTLPIDAAPGTAATLLKGVKAERMSPSATAEGAVAIVNGTSILWLDPATGVTTPAGDTQGQRVNGVEVSNDGTAIFLHSSGRLIRYENGAPVEGWRKPSPGDNARLLDGWWWGSAWHGTIKRHGLDCAPAPGVVLGGNSGSFLGHLDENPEVNNFTGMDMIASGRYVAVGGGGIAQTLDWDPNEACLKFDRRFGALDTCPGVAIDAKGRIFTNSANWEWNDTPVTPVRHGVPPAIAAQPCVVGTENVVAPCWVYTTRPSIFTGTMDKELSASGLPGPLAFSRKVAALAVWREKKQNWMVIAESDGTAHATRIDGNQRPANGGTIQMELGFKEQVNRLTSLAIKPAAGENECDRLFAAVDGAVVELARNETGFAEVARWNAWGDGADERFGQTIHIYAHSGRLWVSDTDRARALVFDIASGASAPLAQFGATDKPGTSLETLDHPAAIAAYADRAVVYDAANQRLVKLEFER